MTQDTGRFKREKLAPELVSVGQALPVDVFAQNGFLLLRKGYYVLTEAQKQKLETLGVTQVKEAKPESSVLSDEEEGKAQLPGPFEEMSNLYQRTRALLHQSIMVRAFPATVLKLAQNIIRLAETHPDAMIASILLVPFREYGPAHSVHTAGLLALLTRRMTLTPSQRETLLCAALTMNIAMAELQDALFAQKEELSAMQHQEIQAHPLLSSAILREVGVEDELWHTLVQTHHESLIGNGYPFALERALILPPAHILHLADIVCAKLTPRRYRSALAPATALGHIFQRKDAEFDSAFTTMLIKELGIYPPGSFVKLASNEIGVVTHRGTKPMTPQVAALRKIEGAPYIDPLPRETHNPAYKIIEPCTLQQAGVRPSYLSHLWKN